MAGEYHEQGDEEYYLACHAEDYRFPCFADALEECCGDDLESDHPEHWHGVAQAVGCDGYEAGVDGEYFCYCHGH